MYIKLWKNSCPFLLKFSDSSNSMELKWGYVSFHSEYYVGFGVNITALCLFFRLYQVLHIQFLSPPQIINSRVIHCQLPLHNFQQIITSFFICSPRILYIYSIFNWRAFKPRDAISLLHFSTSSEFLFTFISSRSALTIISFFSSAVLCYNDV